MTHYITLFMAGFASVFLLGFQSRCVNHGNYAQAACCSFTIALVQTTLWVGLIRDATWLGAAVYGVSGACAITSSMYVHHRWVRPRSTP